MAYSTDNLRTAGKITVFTTIVGVFAFAVFFLSNLGNVNDGTVIAQQQATTSVVVINLPPSWTVIAQEEFGSSSTQPTNAGNEVSWVAVGTDSNGEDYYLIVCSGTSTPAPPTANNSAPPTCAPSTVQWGVSTATVSGSQARVATTTTASATPFAGEDFDWWGWICDGNFGTPRCNATAYNGSSTTASPFVVNHRPDFSIFTDTSPTLPGAVVTFYSTSSDPDNFGGQDTVRLIVCDSPGFSTSTDTCTGSLLASTTFPGATAHASTTYTISIPTQDTNYQAVGYVIDNHGFESLGAASGTDSILTVANAAPTTSPATITLNGGSDIVITEAASQTPNFTLDFYTADANSCDALGGGPADEIVDYRLSVYRAGVGSTTCTTAAGSYDPNNCYPSELATAAWNLSCTASTTSCTGSSDVDMLWECTFPLWYIADPTDVSTEFTNEGWVAQVQAIDDNSATGSLSEAAATTTVLSALYFTLNTLTIPYGNLAPGDRTDPLVATTTLAATGNVGVDTIASGTAMCTTYTGATPCQNSSTSTISEYYQVYATSTVTYNTASSAGSHLSSTTGNEIEVNVPKTQSTSTASTSDAFWGIEVPSSITFSGAYYGQNTFIAVKGEVADW